MIFLKPWLVSSQTSWPSFHTTHGLAQVHHWVLALFCSLSHTLVSFDSVFFCFSFNMEIATFAGTKVLYYLKKIISPKDNCLYFTIESEFLPTILLRRPWFPFCSQKWLQLVTYDQWVIWQIFQPRLGTLHFLPTCLILLWRPRREMLYLGSQQNCLIEVWSKT